MTTMNINCSEYVFDDLLVVTAIPVEDYDIGGASWQVSKTIPSEAFQPVLTNAVVIGVLPATENGKVIPIVRTTGKAKDAEGDSVAGRMHTVTVTCEADNRDWEAWDLLLALERTPSHLLLTVRNGQQAFVAATADTYLCEVERDGAKTAVTFKIHNLLGIQLIHE